MMILVEQMYKNAAKGTRYFVLFSKLRQSYIFIKISFIVEVNI